MKRKKLLIGLALIVVIIMTAFFYNRVGKDLVRNTERHAEDTLHWIATNHGSLHIKTFFSDSISSSPNLVFVIHGDAPISKPSYQYAMAKNISTQNENTIAIGVLRPGYTDSEENTSNGVRGLTNGDNYTPENIDAIAELIAKLKKIYHPGKTVIVGHSGGSAITADIVGLYPAISQAAVLVSCPCDVPKFRKHMRELQNNPVWDVDVKSISPVDLANKVRDDVQIVLVIGEQDDVTPIELSRAYLQKLKSLGKRVEIIPIPNEGHEILLTDAVMNAVSLQLK